MATYAICAFDATDEAGNILTGSISVEVRRSTGGLEPVYSDRAGLTALGNPFTASGGKIEFYCAGGAFNITLTQGAYTRTLHNKAVGRAAETDLQLTTPQGEWGSGTTYAQGDLVSVTVGSDVFLFVSLIDGNLNNAPDSATPGDTADWMYAGTASAGPAGPPGGDGVDALSEATTTIVTTAGTVTVAATDRAFVLNLGSPGTVTFDLGAVALRGGQSLKISDAAGNATVAINANGSEKIMGLGTVGGASSGQGAGSGFTITLFPNSTLGGWFQ